MTDLSSEPELSAAEADQERSGDAHATPGETAPQAPGVSHAPPLNADDPAFLHRYLARAGRQLPGRQQAALLDVARAHFAAGSARAEEATLIEVYDLDGTTTVIDIVTLDAPYLVDSVTAELGRTGYPVEHLLHPQLVVRRDDSGHLTEVLDIADTATVPAGARTESWMHVETNLIPSNEHQHVAADLRRVIADVRAAVDDAPELYAMIRSLADEISEDPGQFDRETSTEAAALLRWLADGNFLILGHAAYSANELASSVRSESATESLRGVLRGEASISPLELLPAYRSGAPLVIFKSPMVSTVRRSARYDCVTVIAPGEGGTQKIHVFLGLITDETDGTVGRVPVLRRRIAEVLQRSGARADSHTGRQLITALRTLPRDELLEAGSPDLLRLAELVVDRAERGGIGVFARTHLNRDFVSVLVYFPADRLGPETRRRVRDVILVNWPGRIIARDDRLVELGMARMHFLIALRPGAEVPNPQRAAVEATVAQVTRRWSDDLADLLMVGVGEEEAERLLRRYSGSFPEAYKEDFPASTAVTDLRRLEMLPDLDGLSFDVYTPAADDVADRRLKVYRTGTPLSLGRTLPMLEQMGIEVLDERPYELERTDGTAAWIYDFGLRIGDGVDFGAERATAVIETLRVLWSGEIEQDGFNALVVSARLSWQQAMIVRAYAKYLRQAGTTFSQGYIEQALVQNSAIAALLVELFETRFDPDADFGDDAEAGAAAAQQHVEARIEQELTTVTSLDQDRILRSLLALITATLRTNYYRGDSSGLPGTDSDSTPARSGAFAIKLDSRAIADLPEPRPRFEIWVYSPRVEGVHLRFGAVARGGLRWSDRREDFRTEILGLVKAQMVKNTVIVPTGSKGGFVAKQLPDPAVDRDSWLAEGVACYKVFITSLLELTDNYRLAPDGTQVVAAPPRTRRYDGDDPYLVVAADKGTATFSDIANSISVERGFWLGDAFASGGSVGYDHKAMGITARGAWESVRYHFRELGVDTQTQDFTVVGVGDMSGDVFGNGMLLSRHIRLVAAFDHRHIFLDPNPDAATSFAERARLFALPRSSWDDYDRSLISAGGGVIARSAKVVDVSPEVAAALDMPAGTTRMSPSALIHAILVAPVDLLWNGGIGTYVKASTESNLDAGDKANDSLRADGNALRCKVVGEGGNLGLTQLGRVEFARAGGRINTDAIDNSAGVDTSDHEVNIKILLDRVVQAGAIDVATRNELLLAQTDAVGALVLRDNYEQNVLLGVGRHGARALLSVHRRLIRELEKAGELDRAIEFLPTDKELGVRESNHEGLTSPELAVLAAYVKIVLSEALRESSLPDEAWFRRQLNDYFPEPIAREFDGELEHHPLHREIITTCVVNDMVNRCGTTFAFRAREESGADVAQVTRAYAVVREVFGLPAIWAEIESLDNKVPTDAQHIAYREVRRTIDRAVRWLIDVRFPISDVAAEINRFAPIFAELAPRVPELLRGRERTNLDEEIERLVGLGLPRELAARISELLSSFLLLDVVEIALANDRSPAEVADLHFAMSEQLSVDDILYAVTSLPREDRWSALARAAMRHDVYAALAAVTTSVLRATPDDVAAEERLQAWAAQNPERVQRARSTFSEALSRDTVDLATLSVALRVMRGLPS